MVISDNAVYKARTISYMVNRISISCTGYDLKEEVLAPMLIQQKGDYKKRAGYAIIFDVFKGSRNNINSCFTLKQEKEYKITVGVIIEKLQNKVNACVIVTKNHDVYITTEFILSTFGKKFLKDMVPELVERGCKVIFVKQQFLNDFTFEKSDTVQYTSVKELLECNKTLLDEFKRTYQQEQG